MHTPFLDHDTPQSDYENQPGEQSKTCASHLMKLLFGARMACPWLLVPITRLASFVTRWTRFHDAALKRLMAFCCHNSNLVLRGTLSTADLLTCELHCYPDADLAGDHSSTRSTSGLWLELVSADGERAWPIAWSSKKQTATASSTCEAEMLSLSSGLRKEALPSLTLLELLLGRSLRLVTFEDNTATISCVKSGYSPALRHMQRTARVSLGFLNEVFFGEDGDSDTTLIKPVLQHCPTASMG